MLSGLGALAVSSTNLFSANASTLSPRFDIEAKIITSSTPNHAVFLRCKVTENSEYQSKGIILKLPNELTKSGKDFALVTAHGLTNNNNCQVNDFQGNTRQVLKTYFAKNYQTGTDSDWALISIKKINGPHIKRYKLDDYLDNIESLDNNYVSFAEARGLPENTQKCRVALVSMKVSHNETRPFVSHDCHAIGGQSGSPITVSSNGEHRLIGLHLGNIWTLNSPMTGKPGKLNFMRPYNKKMASEIKSILEGIE